MAHGGRRPGAGRKPKPKTDSTTPTVPAEPKRPDTHLTQRVALMLPEIEEISKKYARRPTPEKTLTASPFRLPQFPKGVIPPTGNRLAMDEAIGGNIDFANNEWSAGAYAAEGLAFLGYTYLSELAQRPEYRVISETIADDATRKWIDFDLAGEDKHTMLERAMRDPVGEAERQADPDERTKRIARAGKADKVKRLKDDQLRLNVQQAFYDCARTDGFFGRSHLFIDLGTDDPTELKMPIGSGRDDLSKMKIGKDSLKGLRVIEPVWTYPQAYNAVNPLKPDWYNPQQWYVMGQEIHVSRLPVFIGHPVPDMLKPAYAFGGLSLSQMAKPYVDIWLTTRQSVSDLIHSFSVMVLMTDLSTLLQSGSAGDLMARVALFNMMRDNQGAFVVNKATEDFKNVSASLSGLHELQAQAQEHMASVSRIPLVKLTGISPSGLNASSEGEILVYDDTIMAYQNRFFRTNLQKVIDIQQLSLFGEIDPEITWHFEPLRQMTQAEKGQKEKDDADRNQKYVDMGALAPEEIRQVIIDDETLPYTGLDPDDMPEPPDPLEMGGEESDAFPVPAPRSPTPRDRKPGSGGFPGSGGAGGFAGDAEFKEHEHPRGPDGKFTSGSGGGGGKVSEVGSKKRSTGPRATPEGSGGSGERKTATAAALYQAPTRSADEIVASFPGGREAVERTRERLRGLTPTSALVSDGGFKNPDGTYTAERQALHMKIVEEIFSPEKIAAALPAPGETPVMVMLGGRGGSGKSWLTGPDGPVDGSKMLLIDADDIKSKLPGYEGWNASIFHEESSDILKAVDEQARALGVNTVLDATMKSEASSAMRMADYESAGYEIEGYYMYAAPEEAATRAMSRYSKGGTFSGRFVPPEVILGNTNNEQNFDKLSSGFRKWAVYDNNTLGQKPKLVSRSDD